MNASSAQIKIKLLPRSSKNQIMGKEGDTYKIKVTSPPVDGEANKVLISMLAKKLGVPKSSIDIIVGKTSRTKVVRVLGLDGESAAMLMQSE